MEPGSPKTPPLPPNLPRRTPPRAPIHIRKYATIIPLFAAEKETGEKQEEKNIEPRQLFDIRNKEKN